MMSPEQLEQFKQALIEASDKYIAEGGRIAQGRFYGKYSRCPMGCLLPEISEPMSRILTQKFGFEITDREVWDFVFGFDGSFVDDESPTYLLGRELRAKYINTITTSFPGR